MYADHVTDQHLRKACRKLRGEVADLIRMWKQYQRRIHLANQRFNRTRVPIRRVIGELIVLHRVHFREFFRRRLGRQWTDSLPCDRRLDWNAQCGAELLCCRECLPRHAMPLATLLFENDQDAHMTRTSNFNFSTSFAAAVFASPSKIWVCLLFCGT